MFRIASFGIVLTAVAFLWRPAPTLAGPPESLPYTDSVSGTAELTGGSENTATYQLNGTGSSPELGNFDMEGSDTLVATSVNDDGTFSGKVTDGTFTLTAENGTVSGIFGGTFTVDLDGTATLTLSVRIDPDEGTGAFAGVGGTATTTVILDTTGAFTYTSDGTLRLPCAPSIPVER